MRLMKCVYLAMICILYDVRIAMENGQQTLKAVLYSDEKGFFLGDASQIKGAKPFFDLAEGAESLDLTEFVSKAKLEEAISENLGLHSKALKEFAEGPLTELGKQVQGTSSTHKEFVEGAFSKLCESVYKLQEDQTKLLGTVSKLTDQLSHIDLGEVVDLDEGAAAGKAPTGNPNETK